MSEVDRLSNLDDLPRHHLFSFLGGQSLARLRRTKRVFQDHIDSAAWQQEMKARDYKAPPIKISPLLWDDVSGRIRALHRGERPPPIKPLPNPLASPALHRKIAVLDHLTLLSKCLGPRGRNLFLYGLAGALLRCGTEQVISLIRHSSTLLPLKRLALWTLLSGGLALTSQALIQSQLHRIQSSLLPIEEDAYKRGLDSQPIRIRYPFLVWSPNIVAFTILGATIHHPIFALFLSVWPVVDELVFNRNSRTPLIAPKLTPTERLKESAIALLSHDCKAEVLEEKMESLRIWAKEFAHTFLEEDALSDKYRCDHTGDLLLEPSDEHEGRYYTLFGREAYELFLSGDETPTFYIDRRPHLFLLGRQRHLITTAKEAFEGREELSALCAALSECLAEIEVGIDRIEDRVRVGFEHPSLSRHITAPEGKESALDREIRLAKEGKEDPNFIPRSDLVKESCDV